MKKLLIIIPAFALLYTGCVKRPLVEINRAKDAIEQARKAGAPTYAPDEFKSAEDFLQKALREMEAGKYPAARASAMSAENLAKQALAKALKAKEEREEKSEEEKGPPLPPAPPSLPELKITKEDIVGKASMGEGVVIKQLKKVHFAFDDYSLSDEAKEIIKENFKFLQPFLKSHPDYVVVIEGHCDERGTEEYNLALGAKRADSVKKYLILLGLPREKIETISYGESVPEDPRHNEEAWAKNRRAVFVLKKR